MSTTAPSDPIAPLLNPPSGRSPTIVAAYLMYSRHLDTDAALQLIRESRPDVEYVFSTESGACHSPITSDSPNPGFLEQLDVFHCASYKVSRNEKATRMFYLERAVREIMSK